MVLEAGRGATGPLSIQNMLLLETRGDSKNQKVLLVLNKEIKAIRLSFSFLDPPLCQDQREDGDAGAAWAGCMGMLPASEGTTASTKSSSQKNVWEHLSAPQHGQEPGTDAWPQQGVCQAPGTASPQGSTALGDQENGSYPGDSHNRFGSKKGSWAP